MCQVAVAHDMDQVQPQGPSQVSLPISESALPGEGEMEETSDVLRCPCPAQSLDPKGIFFGRGLTGDTGTDS
jgi:hypothetical protein